MADNTIKNIALSKENNSENPDDLEISPELEIIEQGEQEKVAPAGEAVKNIETEKLPSDLPTSSPQSANQPISQSVNTADDTANASTSTIPADDILYKTFEDLLKLINKGVASTTVFARKVLEAFLSTRGK